MSLFAGRVVVVTGGVGGLGRAYCRAFSQAGASVVVADMVSGKELVDELTAEGGSAISIEVDVADLESTQALAEQTLSAFGKIDVLVNNAGYYLGTERGRLDEIDVEEWDKCFAVNVRGSWLCARAVAPNMRERGYGRIVNTGSMTVIDGTVGFPQYVASKAAVTGLTRALARELGPHGIAVNTVTPDYIPHDATYSASRPQVDEFSVSRRSLPRTQTPEDLIGTLMFLAGDDAAFVTGQNILVNGGSVFL